MTTDKVKKYVLSNLPYVLIFWFTNKLGTAYRLAEGTDFLKKLTGSMVTLNTAITKPFPSFVAFDLFIGVAGAAIIYAVVYFRGKNAKKYRKGVEYGSARWGKPPHIASNENFLRPLILGTHWSFFLTWRKLRSLLV